MLCITSIFKRKKFLLKIYIAGKTLFKIHTYYCKFYLYKKSHKKNKKIKQNKIKKIVHKNIRLNHLKCTI